MQTQSMMKNDKISYHAHMYSINKQLQCYNTPDHIAKHTKT